MDYFGKLCEMAGGRMTRLRLLNALAHGVNAIRLTLATAGLGNFLYMPPPCRQISNKGNYRAC